LSPEREELELLVGLGNPGERYTNTRHNMGFLVLDELARRHGLGFRRARHGVQARWGRVQLLKPNTFMNRSGLAVQGAIATRKLAPGQVLLVHDDLDLPLGRLRFRKGGSAGGQRGVSDTISRIGPDFWRLKLGISRPPEGWRVENWVLSRFRDEEITLVSRVVDAAATAIELALEEGVEAAMNDTNGLDLREQGLP